MLRHQTLSRDGQDPRQDDLRPGAVFRYLYFFGDGPEAQEDLLKDLSKHKSTLVLYMSLHSMPTLVEKVSKYHHATLPLAVVYFAGFPDKETVVRGTLKTSNPM